MPLRGNIFGISRKCSPKIRKRFSSTQPPPKSRRPIASAAFFHQRFFSERSKSSSIHTRIQRGNPDSRQNGIAVSVFRTPPRPEGPKNRISRGSKTRLLKFPHYLFDFSLGPGPRTFLPIKKALFFFTAACGKFTKKTSTSKGKMPKKYEVPATVSPAAPPQRGSVQSGECWTAGNPGAAGR